MAPNFYRISPNCSSRFPLNLITPQGLSLIPSTELFPRGHLKEGPPWHSVLPNLHLMTRFSLPSRKTIPLPTTNPAHLFYLPQLILILLHQNEPHSFAFWMAALYRRCNICIICLSICLPYLVGKQLCLHDLLLIHPLKAQRPKFLPSDFDLQAILHLAIVIFIISFIL